MKKARSFLLISILLAFQTTFAQPNYQVEHLIFMVSNRGAVRISGEGYSLGTGSLMSWGPAWQWQDPCSWQDSWRLVSGPTGSEAEFEVECHAQCNFANFRPKMKYWFGTSASLLEINVTTVSDSSFAGMSWTLQISVDQFKGRTIYIIGADGKLTSLRLREEYLQGQAQLVSVTGAAGWVIPATEDAGIVYSVLSDLWPQGIPVSVDDEREWAGGTYALRNWLSQQFQLPANQTLRLLIYMIPYKGDPTPAVDQVVEVLKKLASGSTLSELKAEIIAQIGVEEALKARVSPTTVYAPYVFLAVAVLATVAVAFILLRRRSSS
ncbi:MAG: hypothetical protein NZ954_02210 [Thermofilaceae archaeon]|nr:hypothetical protein [Thermofilaceae archaeon]MCX8180922.1 hypothetical protein [Thermofilaceae archaeon]MDW8003487.1 hypothetical protein [Thermofilaceae archaeon]